MPTNNIKIFDENKTNMLTDVDYSTNAQRLNGVQSGVASSQLQNKTLYQTSLISYAIAQFMNEMGFDASDSGAVSTFVNNLSSSIKKPADNDIKYIPQSITDAQRQQARANIAAAPDGFGLGGSATMLTPADNLDALMENGWFQYDRNNPPQGTLPSELAPYVALVHVSTTGAACVQEAYDITDSEMHGIVLRRTVYGVGPGAKIYPWEWVNPFMNLGVEYRTTERYLGSPVYKKLLLFTGAMTDGYSDMEHNIANIGNVVGCYAELFVDSASMSTPILDGNNTIIFSATSNSIRKTSVGDYSAYSARILMSYTKYV